MIIRITDSCQMQCSHCMIDKSSPDGDHMTLDVFDQALDLIGRLGARAILISGGEPFDHPDIFEIILRTQKRGFLALVCSNGLFALDPKMRQLAQASGAMIQVTNDPRYYPRNLSLARDIFPKEWSFEDTIRIIFPCRRTREAGIAPTRQSPACFNIRSIVRSYDVLTAVAVLQGKAKLCTPSINVDGSISAGESDSCYKIGSVTSSEGEIDQALRDMHCNRCGLQKNLGPQYLQAIGEHHARL